MNIKIQGAIIAVLLFTFAGCAVDGTAGGTDIPGDISLSFKIFHETTEIKNTLAIPSGESKIITVKAAETGVSFTWASSNSGAASLSVNSGDSVIITAATGTGGYSDITVTAEKNGQKQKKAFTIVIDFITREENVIFKWDSAFFSIPDTIEADTPIDSGFEGVDFRVHGAIGTVDGAFRITGAYRLAIGSTANTGTNSTTHCPGVFDVSDGAFRLTIDYKNEAQGSDGYMLRVMFNNNTSSYAYSVLDGASTFVSYSTITSLYNGTSAANIFQLNRPGRIVIILNPSVVFANASETGRESLKDAFIGLCTAGACEMTITGIKLEKFFPRESLSYIECGAVGNGRADDFDRIIETHAIANIIGAKVRAVPGAKFYIGGAAKTARIATDTDWTGMEFYIDDSVVPINGNTWADSWIFDIVSAKPSIAFTSAELASLSFNRDQAQLDIALPSESLVVAVNSNVKRYIRRGANENTGANQTDVFIADRDGNVDQSAPIIWDFNRVTSLTAYPIDNETLTVTGGRFTTIANRGIADNSYMKRGIRVMRSNTVIDGIYHMVVGEGAQGAAYSGFISIASCADIIVKNTTFTGHRGYPEYSGTIRGSYDLNVSQNINLSVINCNQTNSIHDTTYWGLVGTNYTKNTLYDNVSFSRVDSHMGVRNITVLNSELGHQGISIIGCGLLKIENTKVSSSRFVNFRSDYGSTWEGNAVIRSCTFVPRNYTTSVVFDTGNDGQWNFGYNCCMPETITVEGLVIDESSAPSGYNGILLVGADNTGAEEKYPFTLTKTINLSGFISGKPYRMPNDYVRDSIAVNQYR